MWRLWGFFILVFVAANWNKFAHCLVWFVMLWYAIARCGGWVMVMMGQWVRERAHALARRDVLRA